MKATRRTIMVVALTILLSAGSSLSAAKYAPDQPPPSATVARLAKMLQELVSTFSSLWSTQREPESGKPVPVVEQFGSSIDPNG